MKKSIAVDMDNVIVDIEANWINWYADAFGIRITKQDMHGIPEDQAFPDPLAARSLIYKPGFFRNAPVIPGSQEAIIKLQENYEVYIVSAAMEFPNSLSEKHDWLAEHFPSIHWRNIIFCGDKSVINTDYLIDDHFKNLDFHKGKPILFTAGHNRGINRHTRVNSWEEVLELLEHLEERQQITE
ncbi:5' nucleotidase, NT5C type [Dyadobacter endophyticus]|uniref:5'-3'-deoxyribonucleotidase n=1 Tax=Dyadobacter endophyticus TaxID=1749036 RepID=A0ABQ1YWW5_9BACT|nr:5'(3')-deoxyribonucleotidase [Dyadobacter endophyticus]GGH40070.1 5'-3'-deoxyribonucleotidase [Dyadobacter endophyticus]